MTVPTAPAPEATAGGPPRTSTMATWSLVASVFGFVCFWGIGGLLGIALGVMAKGEIERSEGRLVGSGQALAGIVLGAINLVAFVAGMGVMFALLARPSSSASSPAYTPPTAVAPAPVPAPAASGAPMSGARAATTRDKATVTTRVGKIVLVDLGDDVRSLGHALDEQRAAAKAERQTLVLWTVAPSCEPCNGVAASLPDPRLQEALAGVRLVRVDVRAFSFELSELRVPTSKIPGFALLGQNNRPADYVHGGEWDADIAANIAPVLGEFVRGEYKKRRDPWQGGERDDETTL